MPKTQPKIHWYVWYEDLKFVEPIIGLEDVSFQRYETYGQFDFDEATFRLVNNDNSADMMLDIYTPKHNIQVNVVIVQIETTPEGETILHADPVSKVEIDPDPDKY